MKTAERFGQPPHEVAHWPADWLAVCQTAMAAETGAEAELAKRRERKANRRGRGR